MGYLGNTVLDKFIDSDTTFYISPSGSDVTGTGSSSKPWATLHHAMDYLGDYFWQIGTVNVTIEMDSGTYDYTSHGPINLNHVCGGGLKIVGTESADTSATILQFNGCDGLSISNKSSIALIDNFTIEGSGSIGYGLYVENNSRLEALERILIKGFDIGIYCNRISSVHSENDVYKVIRECNTGILTIYGSSIEFAYGIIKNCNSKGISIFVGSNAYIRYGTIHNCTDYGVNCRYNSFVDAHEATIYNCGTGLYATRRSVARIDDADIDNCDYGLYASYHSFAYANITNIDHDGVGGDGSYGIRTYYNSYIDAQNTTVDSSGHITDDYDPNSTTANDPTFDNRGSWIYG